MGARGPVREPRNLKIIRTIEPDAEAETLAEEVEPSAPDMPDGLPEGARDIWNVLVPQLDELGLISKVDGFTVELAIRHYLAAVQASDELADAASIAIRDEKNDRQQKHPADAVMRLHSAMFLQYADKLGMTFVSRARLAARGGSGDDEDNPFAPTGSTAGGS